MKKESWRFLGGGGGNVRIGLGLTCLGYLRRSRGWGESRFVVEMVVGWMIWMIVLLYSFVLDDYLALEF